MNAEDGYLTLAEKRPVFTQFVCAADTSATVDIWEHITRTAATEVFALDFDKARWRVLTKRRAASESIKESER